MRRLRGSDIYLSASNLINIEILNNIIIDRSLNIKYVEDALIYSGYWEFNNRRLTIQIKNKYDEVIDHSPFRECNNKLRFLPKHLPIVTVKEPYIFGGLVDHHYGHFIMETLSRFSLGKDFSLKFALFEEIAPQSYKDFLNDCNIKYDLFDIRKNNFIFKKIFIPDPGIELQSKKVNYYHKNLEKMLDTQVVPSKNKILYISKKKYCQNNTNCNTVIDYNFEQSIEDFLIKNYGAQILYPDNHSIKSQINFINEHEIIIGPWGSGMHTVLLAKSPKKVIYIIPTPTVKDPGHITMRLLGHIKTDIIKGNKSFYLMDEEVNIEFGKIMRFFMDGALDYNKWCINNIKSEADLSSGLIA